MGKATSSEYKSSNTPVPSPIHNMCTAIIKIINRFENNNKNHEEWMKLDSLFQLIPLTHNIDDIVTTTISELIRIQQIIEDNLKIPHEKKSVITTNLRSELSKTLKLWDTLLKTNT